MSKSMTALLNLRDKKIDSGITPSSKLSDGGIEMMVEDYGYAYTKNYLKGL